ncbi:component of the polarisome [Thecaphora frezii]
MMQAQSPAPHQQFSPYMGSAGLANVSRSPMPPAYANAPNGAYRPMDRPPQQTLSPQTYNNLHLEDPSRRSVSSTGSGAEGSRGSGVGEGSQASSSRFRRARPDTEEIRRVGRAHYVELLNYLRSHLIKGEFGRLNPLFLVSSLCGSTDPEPAPVLLLLPRLGLRTAVEQSARTSAREKLTRLSKQQFTELSTDVYDELMRRQNNAKNGNSTPFLAVRDEFHPKRNQARQKLATLPKNRFKDLASDVFFELERRFPELKEEFRADAIARERERAAREREELEALQRKESIGNPQGSTSDRLIPAKSTMVEEDIAVPYSKENVGGSRPGRSSHPDELDRPHSTSRDSVDSASGNGGADNRSTMYSQASSVGTGFLNGYSQSSASPNPGRGSGFENGTSTALATQKMRSDYELRIAKLQQQVSSLESQHLDALPRARKADELTGRNQELERQLKDLQAELRETKERHEESIRDLREDSNRYRELHDLKHQELQSVREEMQTLQRQAPTRGFDQDAQAELEATQKEFAEQATVVQELKEEVSSLLEELRQLSDRHDEVNADRESDAAIIKDLHSQIASYKRMYEAAKTELRTLKATSQLYVQPSKVEDFMPASDRGAIADVNLTAFQSSIDELLAAARSKTPSNVLLSMKTVVLATTLVTDDVAKYEQVPANLADLSHDELEQLQALKTKCSGTLNNLMTACRNHASSHGLSPVSLLDAAASHVSTTIVDLVKLLKVRRASKVETDDFEAQFKQNPNGTLPNGLKPLHISAQSAALRDASSNGILSPNTSSFTAGGLQPSSAADDRFSPRLRHSPQMGRYSPVGYKADAIRKDSNGEAAWQSRAASVSSSSSGAHRTPSLATMPSSSGIAFPRQHSGDMSVTSSSQGVRSSGATGEENMMPRSETNDSLHSDASGFGSGTSIDNGHDNWAELRNYIEVQTEAIVHSIQALLSAIREGAQGVQLNENLTQITTIVSSIVAISKGNLPAKSRAAGERILNELTDHCEKLSEMQSHPSFDKTTKAAMASASYGVAKGLKALNGLLSAGDGPGN